MVAVSIESEDLVFLPELRHNIRQPINEFFKQRVEYKQ